MANRKFKGTEAGTPAQSQFDAMFSAASFFDVIEAPTAEPATAPNHLEDNGPYVVAFYGLKGGAGRTTALAHVGALLAERGAKIVAIDLDLEAPGLHTVAGVALPKGVNGSAALLRKAMVVDAGVRLDVRSSLLPVELDSGAGSFWVMPAGALDIAYLATIDELNVGVWNALPTPQPLQRLLQEVWSSDVAPTALFLDCRPGFNQLSATALFHVADLVVVCLPISPQVWEGLDLVVDAAVTAAKHRRGRPALLLVPSLVPPEPIGGAVRAQFEDELLLRYAGKLAQSDAETSESPDEPDWVAGSIYYDPALAGMGRLSASLRSTSWNQFRALADDVGVPIHVSVETLPNGMKVEKVLEELKIDTQAGFADDVTLDDLVDTFVAPGDLTRLLDRSVSLVVGAKGAGKTWLFRYLVGSTHKTRPHVPTGMEFIVGHAPASVEEKGPLHLSKDALKEMERSCKMKRAGTYAAMWRLYGAVAICKAFPQLRGLVGLKFSGGLRKTVNALLAAASATILRSTLEAAMKLDNAGTLAQDVLVAIDEALLENDLNITLVYDGLDTGFDTGTEDAEDRQDRFIKALLQLVLERRDFRRVQFKVFLREDLFRRIEMQNKSHLEATKMELRWRPADLWRMALVRARESREYRRVIAALPGGTDEPATIGDEAALRRLLDPLWGSTVQGKRKARTALYIQKRTSDAAGRLFPRTLMQLLAAAIAEERRGDRSPRDRVLRFPAIRHGVELASKKRVDDLIAEYKELGPYLSALRGRNPTGTPAAFINYLVAHVERGTAGRRGGAEPGSLHAGPGGWKKVIVALRDVGVLNEYKRAPSSAGEEKLAIAILYRPGLDIKAAG